jgi:ubiquitin C-terminal hydrolase
MKGFQNIGNTCYLNAGLQMLIQNKRLCSLIKKYSEMSSIFNVLNNHINNYYDKSITNAINPSEIKSMVESKQNMFMGFQQQDSTEFILYLIDIIDEELKIINRTDELKLIFGININTRTKCKKLDCLKISNKNEISNILLLDIESHHTNLNDVYRNLKARECLDGENKYKCDNCNDKRVASKRIEIIDWPNELFIWLKRFKQNTNGSYTKNGQPIIAPLKWRHNMMLQGAVIHYGGLNGGHYVYVGKNDEKWFVFDDTNIKEIKDMNELESLISNAYWLYYQKN